MINAKMQQKMKQTKKKVHPCDIIMRHEMNRKEEETF
jgi:hypothetical protein